MPRQLKTTRRQMLTRLLDCFRKAKPGDSVVAECGCAFDVVDRPDAIWAAKQVKYCREHRL